MVNETIPTLIEPITISVKNFINILQVGIGGLFGLYLILVILKWREARFLKKTVLEIKNQIKQLNEAVVRIETSIKKKVTHPPKKR